VLAWALYKNGLCAEARRVSLRSLRLGTLDVDGLYHHALIARCLGRQAEAERYLARVEALAPRYLDAPPSAKRLTP
jgi:Tfp pilus assembly protein PilF